MQKIFLLFSFSLIALAPFAASQPSESREEVRAVWITTVLGLDWPQSYDTSEQRESLLRIIRTLKEENFNTIFFQVRSRGDAYYRSSYEPWAENLTGTLGKDPGYDPLAYVIDEAHQAGLEVHAWFNLYKVDGPARGPSSGLAHVAEVHPDWVFPYENELWLNPGIPGVNEYLLDVALEVAANYPVDGIQFDFVRYPGRNVPDRTQFEGHSGGTLLAEWRRGNVDRFLADFYGRATMARPNLKIGATPLGNYKEGAEFPEAYSEVYQNAVGWLDAGIVDYIVPQIYWDLEATREDPGFAAVAARWRQKAHGRQVYAGIGAYKPAVQNELFLQIDASRENGLEGQAFFRLGNLTDFSRLRGRYEVPASVPAMPWKGLIPTHQPAVIAADTVTELSPLLTALIDSSDRSRINLAYRLPQPSPISIVIHTDPQRSPNPELIPVTHGMRDAGVYVMSFDRTPIPAGEYFIVLRAGQSVVSRRLTLPPL